MTTREPQLTPALSTAEFRRRFIVLILLTWTVPPVFGLSFLLFIRMFTVEQMQIILTTPTEPAFIVGWLLFAVWYFNRFAQPIRKYLEAPTLNNAAQCLGRMRRFPVDFWVLFLVYIVMAPSSVIISAERHTAFFATPEDWFRIHLVALIVSIIVGLPIFFRVLDLFGRTLSGIGLKRPHVTVRAKVFLIGALMPLLVDTMIVQYYWTRTGYFTMETFMVWLTLELLAIVGSLMFVRSLGQSLQPLQEIISGPLVLTEVNLSQLVARSTDEIGVLATAYRQLLQNINSHQGILALTNRILGSAGAGPSMDVITTSIINMCQEAIGGDNVFLILHDPERDELIGVAQTDTDYNPAGHFRLSLDETSMAVWAFKEGRTTAIADVQADPRVSPRMCEKFRVRSALATPLFAEGHAIGVLMTVNSTHRRTYSAEDIALIENFAREAALAVHTWHLQEQRAQAESLRRDQEDQVRLLLDSTAEAIFGVDLRGDCTFVNRACLRALGYQDERDLLGTNMHELIHHTRTDGTPYPKDECQVHIDTLAGRIGHSDDEVHWRADGSSFPVEYWSHPIYKNGDIIGAVVTFFDVTERKQAQEALQRLSEYNRLLLESTGEGIFGVDVELRCTFANRAAASMLGYTPEELRGQDVHELIYHSDEDGTPIERDRSLLFRTIQDNASHWGEDEVLWHRDGTAIPVQFLANPIHEGGRVTGAVVVYRNVAEARAMARKMDYLASHDPLTGLVNRREFEQRLEQALTAGRRKGTEHVLFYMDLDQFKVVNDTCGHVAGDELLRQLTLLLHTKVRQGDVLARLGGDEFGLLLEHCPLSQALQIADELRATISDFRFAWEDKTFTIGVSIGVVAINAETDSLAHALSAADAACYVAKDRGRNRIHVYQVHDEELTRRRGEMQWVSRINDALENDGLRLSCQLIAPLSRPEAGCHIEILLRMRDQDGNDVPPGAFIPAAERYNLMPAIDRWVVDTTFRWLHERNQDMGQLALCTINLSGHSIGEEQFLQFVMETLKNSAVPPDKICFEVTETSAVANLSRAIQFMQQLKAEGCRFALDDFGSGMSSFAYLKNLPVDYLKIDGNFVRDMVTDPIDRAMVEAINQVGHVMGIETIAEFVENGDILAELKKIGVDYAQGYGVAAPQPLDELVECIVPQQATGS